MSIRTSIMDPLLTLGILGEDVFDHLDEKHLVLLFQTCKALAVPIRSYLPAKKRQAAVAILNSDELILGRLPEIVRDKRRQRLSETFDLTAKLDEKAFEIVCTAVDHDRSRRMRFRITPKSLLDPLRNLSYTMEVMGAEASDDISATTNVASLVLHLEFFWLASLEDDPEDS